LWLWYGVPAALFILIIMVLLIMILIWQRQGSRKGTSDSSRDYKPYAYLVTQDEAAIRYPITRTIWRIGRNKDNELTLRDNSVSRRHAEIHRKFNGKFDIVDIDSVNGVYVNDKKISKIDLTEGDMVEIGDIVMQFTQYPSDYSQDDATEIQKTKAPVTH
jgi:pSer/pThr/pTyr-binding forkhead associated (FHA) protein